MRVLGQERVWACVDIGEIASPTAGYPDLLTRCLRVVDDQDTLAHLPGHTGAHHARCARAQDRHIVVCVVVCICCHPPVLTRGGNICLCALAADRADCGHVVCLRTFFAVEFCGNGLAVRFGGFFQLF